MHLTSLLLAVHAAATLSMVGVIWFVQIVHYPLFSKVGRAAFPDYEVWHQRRTTWVVAPLMFAELGSALLLVWLRPSEVPLSMTVFGLVLIGLIWASTFFWQVPLHGSLSESFDLATQRRLVRSNWLRTALWSIRGAVALWMLSVA